MRAAGVSVWQFMLPAMIVAFLLGIVFVCVYNPIAATARAEAERLYADAFDREETLLKTKNAGAWLREDGADGPSVVHAHEVSNQGLELTGVTVFQYDPRSKPRRSASKRVRRSSRTAAGSSRTPGLVPWASEPAFYKRYLLSTYLTPTQVRDSLGTEFSISFWDLPNFIEIAERAGLPATQYRVQYQLLLSRPFLLVTMVLIAATCSLRAFRFGNVQLNALFGIAAGFAFFVARRNLAQLRHGGTDLRHGRGLGAGHHRGEPRAHRALVQRGRMMTHLRASVRIHAPGSARPCRV